MLKYSVSPRKVYLEKDSNGETVLHKEAEAPVRYYARAQRESVMTFEQFAEHVAGHNSKYHKGDILATIVEVMRCLKEELLNGKQVQLSDLGIFSLSLSGPGAESAKDFNAAVNIRKIKVRWKPGEAFEDLRNDKDLTLEEVLTIKENTAAKKAKKTGTDITPDDGNTGGGSGNTGGSSGNGGGSTGGDDDNAGL